RHAAARQAPMAGQDVRHGRAREHQRLEARALERAQQAAQPMQLRLLPDEAAFDVERMNLPSKAQTVRDQGGAVGSAAGEHADFHQYTILRTWVSSSRVRR